MNIVIPILVMTGAGIVIMRGARSTESLPGLELSDLREFFGPTTPEVNRDPARKVEGADNIQFYTDTASVIYSKTTKGRSIAETFSAHVKGHRGLIVTLVDGHVANLEFVGGGTVQDPYLSIDDQHSLSRFAQEIRRLNRLNSALGK